MDFSPFYPTYVSSNLLTLQHVQGKVCHERQNVARLFTRENRLLRLPNPASTVPETGFPAPRLRDSNQLHRF